MSFNSQNWQRWSQSFDLTNTTFWNYSDTSATLSTILASGFFDPVNVNPSSPQLTINDLIYVSASDGTQLVQVDSINPVVVSVATSALLPNAAQGSILYKGASGWLALPPGTSGEFLQTQGADEDPDWAVAAGAGDLLAANNLSDVADGQTALNNLSNFGGTPVTSDVMTFDGTNWGAAAGGGGGGNPSTTLVQWCTYDATLAGINATYNNSSSGVGATLTNAGTQALLEIDGGNPSVNDLVLVNTQGFNYGNYSDNGIYVVSDVGSPSTNWILTRWSGFDTAAQMTNGYTCFIDNFGNTNSFLGFILKDPPTVIGTDSILFENSVNPYSYAYGESTPNNGDIWTASNSGGYISAGWSPVQIPLTYPVNPSSVYSTVPPNFPFSYDQDTTLVTGTLYLNPITVLAYNYYDYSQFTVYNSNPVVDNIVIGIYLSPDGYNFNLITQCTPRDMAENGIVANANSTFTLNAGTYWIAYTIAGGSPNLTYNNSYTTGTSNSSQIIIGYPGEIASAGPTNYDSYSAFSMSFAYSATLPSTFTSSDLNYELQSNSAANIIIGLQ